MLKLLLIALGGLLVGGSLGLLGGGGTVLTLPLLLVLGVEPKPASKSTLKGTSMPRPMPAIASTVWRSVMQPCRSTMPRDCAMPLRVVPMAGKPAASSMRALFGLQASGIRNMPGTSCKSRKRRAMVIWLSDIASNLHRFCCGPYLQKSPSFLVSRAISSNARTLSKRL